MEVFGPDKIAIVSVMNRVVRRCFLLGDYPVTRKNYDHQQIYNGPSFCDDLLAGVVCQSFHCLSRWTRHIWPRLPGPFRTMSPSADAVDELNRSESETLKKQ